MNCDFSIPFLVQATLQCKQAIQSHRKLLHEKRELVDYISRKSRCDLPIRVKEGSACRQYRVIYLKDASIGCWESIPSY
jgi:hypothetical protein